MQKDIFLLFYIMPPLNYRNFFVTTGVIDSCEEKSVEPDEDIDELLRLQKEFITGGQKPAASCIRPKKSASKLAFDESTVKKSVQFAMPDTENRGDDETMDEKEPLPGSAEPLVGTILERFGGFFEMPDRVVPPSVSVVNISDGFFDADDASGGDLPDVPDLSAYWDAAAPQSSATGGDPPSSCEKNEARDEAVLFEEASTSGKSLFASVFDRIYAKKQERKRVSKFKASRQGDPTETNDSKAAKESQAKASAKECADAKELEAEAIRNLEVIRGYGLEEDTTDDYSRLAMDAMNMNFASKVMKNMVPRQEANILRLFDSLSFPPTNRSSKAEETGKNELCDLARSRLEEIKSLFLEEIQVEEGRRVWRFASDVNPVVNGAWNFVPIRRVLDALQHRDVTDDDVEIVVLTTLWSVLLLVERPSLFHVLSMPNEVYVRVAEIFLIGPAAFENDTVSKCVSILIDDYLLPKGRQNLLTFRLSASIASLDAFMPFFEDLLKHFDEYSTGDTNFALLIFVAAYMNAAIGDGLTLAQAIWAPGRQIVRRMTVSAEKSEPILAKLREWRVSHIAEVESQYYQQYLRLLAMYAAAIRDESVTRDRNPSAFEIAAGELGQFVKRHTLKPAVEMISDECVKEFNILVDVIREATAGKLTL